ncbi:hypothetical protein ACWPKO_06970 [Coraliomargarita sp. W4R53]
MIAISSLQGIPASTFNEIEDFTKKESIEYHIETRENQAMAGLEDFLPAAVMVLLAKPFFDSYLSKAGEDAYLVTKKVFSKLIKACQSLPVYEYSPGKHKIDRNSPNSRLVSLHIKRLDNQPVKLLIPKELSGEEVDQMIDALFRDLNKYYSNDESCLIREELEKNQNRGQSLMYYNVTNRKWSSRSLPDMTQEKLNELTNQDSQEMKNQA